MTARRYFRAYTPAGRAVSVRVDPVHSGTRYELYAAAGSARMPLSAEQARALHEALAAALDSLEPDQEADFCGRGER